MKCHTPGSHRAGSESVLPGSRAEFLSFIQHPLEYIAAGVMIRKDNGHESAEELRRELSMEEIVKTW